jgi:hypothetical protein
MSDSDVTGEIEKKVKIQDVFQRKKLTELSMNDTKTIFMSIA